MSSSKFLSILLFLATPLTAAPKNARAQLRTPLSCSQATMAKAGVGVAYSGDVSIDDYKFRARIPDGLTGWSGVASDAPFHGFTISLDSSMRSCIVFEVHLRIDEDEVPLRPPTAKVLSLGNARAWQRSIVNRNHAKGIINITTYFSSKQEGQTNDGKILLVSRPEELQKTKSIYDAFVKSVAFGVPKSQ